MRFTCLFCSCVHLSFFFILSLFFHVGSTGDVKLDNLCPSEEGGKVVKFTVTDCTAIPCRFVHNHVYTAALTFVSGRNSTFGRIRCSSVVYNQQQNIGDWNACDGLTEDGKCPIIAGLPYTYKTSIKIAPVPPGMYNVACEIVDDGGVRQICARGMAEVVMW